MENTRNAIPSLEAHQAELAERLMQLGLFINLALGDAISNCPGNRMLGLDSDYVAQPIETEIDEVNVLRYRVGRILPFLYDYAYHARRTAGAIDWQEWDVEADDRYIFGAFLEMTNIESVINISAEFSYHVTGHLTRMLKLADARHRLDFEDEVTIADVALLADMEERSVRNCLRTEGANHLESHDGEHVVSAVALRWLLSRRTKFTETVEVKITGEEIPASLSYAEIPGFITKRLATLFPSQEDDTDDCCRPEDKAAKLLGWSYARVLAASQDATTIRPQDCVALAKVLRVDPAWFTEQVMCALFPKEMALIAYRREIEEPEADEIPSFIEVELSEKGIEHGYLDIPASLSAFFPADSFGGRGEHDVGAKIELRYSDQTRMSDIRVKSSIRISPRARFTSYFNGVKARAGDVIRIAKVGERIYEMTHLPK